MTRGLDDQTLTFYETKPLTLKSSNKQSWYFSPFCHRKSRKQTGSVLGLILPQKVHFLSWNMYVWYTIEIISRAFHLNMEYNFHKFEILCDSKFSLVLYESSDAAQQTGIWDGIVNPIYGCGVKMAPDINPIYICWIGKVLSLGFLKLSYVSYSVRTKLSLGLNNFN